MLDRMVAQARQQEVFSREDTSTERRVLAAFLYHAGLSYRQIEPFVERSYEAIKQWFHRLKHLFEPDFRERHEVAVDETEIEIDGEEVYVWAVDQGSNTTTEATPTLSASPRNTSTTETSPLTTPSLAGSNGTL